MPPNSLQLHCQECDKAFSTEQQLKLHKNIKHNKAAIKPQNINSSDSSDDDESLKRYKQKFAKKKPQSRVQPKKGEDDKLDRSMSIPGVFDDTNIEKDAFRKIYLCGCSHKLFESSEMLTLHISKQHNGFPPEGTLYGVCRDSVLRNFQPMEQRPQQIIRSFIQKTQFICGCQQSFTKQSSLLFHIKTMHNDVPPSGTRGISEIDQDIDLFQGNFQGSDSLSIGEKHEESRRCVACFEVLKDLFWGCENCTNWKVCSRCGQDEEIKQTHETEGHSVRKHPQSD